MFCFYSEPIRIWARSNPKFRTLFSHRLRYTLGKNLTSFDDSTHQNSFFFLWCFLSLDERYLQTQAIDEIFGQEIPWHLYPPIPKFHSRSTLIRRCQPPETGHQGITPAYLVKLRSLHLWRNHHWRIYVPDGPSIQARGLHQIRSLILQQTWVRVQFYDPLRLFGIIRKYIPDRF